MAIEDLGLEHGPKRLDLAIGPGRTDLSPQVINVELRKPLAKTSQDVGQPGDKWQPVVTHQLKGLAAELEALIEPLQDGRDLVVSVNPQANEEPRVVVNQSDDPGLQIAAHG